MTNDKELIERLAMEAYEKQMNQELRPQDKPGVFGFCEEFLSAVDAERRKEAVAEVGEFSIYEKHPGQPLPVGTKLFLAPQPAIPEGMTLIPIVELEETKQHKAQAIGLLEFLRDNHPKEFSKLASAGIAP